MCHTCHVRLGVFMAVIESFAKWVKKKNLLKICESLL